MYIWLYGHVGRIQRYIEVQYVIRQELVERFLSRNYVYVLRYVDGSGLPTLDRSVSEEVVASCVLYGGDAGSCAESLC